MDTKKKVILAAVCLELAAMGFAWAFHGKSAGAKPTAPVTAPVAVTAPAAATAPSTTGHVSAYSDKPFTADITISTSSAKFHGAQPHHAAASAHEATVAYHGKIYAERDALRTDMAMGHGVTASVIVRYDKGISWILMPGQHYIESPIEEQTDLLSAMRDTNSNVRKQDLGPEKVGSYACEKYKVDVTSRGHAQSGWIWVATAENLKGFIVKAEDARSKQTVVLSNIQIGAPAAAMFDLPAGYHKLAAAAPGKAAPAHR